MTRSFLPECSKRQEGQDRSGLRGLRSSLPRKRPESFRGKQLSRSGKPTARKAHGGAGQDAGRSESRPVVGRIRDNVPGPKGSPRPAGAPARENLENRLGGGRRKTALRAGAPPGLSWAAVSWQQVYREAWRLQARIAKAVRDTNLLGRLDWPLECSSPVRGNSHAGFQEGCGGGEAPCLLDRYTSPCVSAI